jgi:organic radical activating enzyme
MQSARVVELVRQLAVAGREVMLETNGTLVPALAATLPWLRYVSMDVKLPSVDGEHVVPETQWKFLDTALESGVTTWVKLVIGATVDLREFDRAIAMVSELGDRRHPTVPGTLPGADLRPDVFLQPVTPFGTVDTAPTPQQVLDLQARALRRYPRIRVVPQTHKAIGQL